MAPKENEVFPVDSTQYNLLDRGFRNTRQNGQVTGFQVLLRSGYYRGVWVPLVDSFEVKVDGETFQGDQVLCGFNGKTYAQTELDKLENVRWQWSDPAVLTVRKPGGLKPGWHEVSVVCRMRISYMPVIPSVRTYSANLALVK
jgi:hypothetical protein